MHVDITPRRFELMPGVPQPINVTISNTSDVIGGYAVRILGADPSWITIDDAEISLFPDESRTVSVLVSVPDGMTAGERRLAVQVRELTPPEGAVVEEVVFTVPEAPAVQLRVDPMAVTAGRTARLNLLIDNTGNTPIHRRLHGQDPESRVRFRFEPPILRLEPGEHALVDMRASAKQPFLGNPVVRPLELRLVDPDYVPAAPPPEEKDETAKLARPKLRRKPPVPRIDDETIPSLANATFIQKPVISRGPVSLIGLLIAVTVFAIVITLSLSRLVGQSAADRNLALEIAAARDGGASTGTSGLAGTVSLLTSGAPVEGVTVSVFSAADTEAPLATTATSDQGTWSLGKLAAGDYKVTFRGAGFVQLWYPQALDPADAETVTVEAGADQQGLDVALGGVPASIAGVVDGPDVAAATLTLRAPLSGMAAGTVSPADTGDVSTAQQGAVVMTVPVGDDGSFVLENVPSPSVYDLVVEKPGFATSTQRVDVSAGEERTGVEITLRQGDGLISGIVSSAAGPLGEATITATSGQTTVTTMSVSEGDPGTFSLRGLPTPATFTVVISLADYASQTLTVTLADGQRLTGIGVTLDSSSGQLSGQVLTAADEQPAAGVLVSVTNGVQTVQTATTSSSETEDGGHWKVTGLALPGNYTVTFSRSDLEPQTVALALDAQGRLVTDNGSTATAQEVQMVSATAVVQGTVLQRQRTVGGTTPAAVPIGEATVTLTSNASTYTVTTASVPQRNAGQYRIAGVPPGTYTLSIGRNGVSPVSQIVELTAGQTFTGETTLSVAASVTVTVVDAQGSPVGPGWVVELYRYAEYPDSVYRLGRTGQNSTVTFEDVDAPGAYIIQIKATRGGASRGSTTIRVDASESATATVEARSDG
ncbi:carboxypeptidase regulatory-like domain-containing protein [Nocardioides sp. W7]|uniref:carboxypeptidase regulatory-like domain-containing protein n=1 Tax=Nocardioides sp. W7 TaxID=2931390 RepID=UPI001FD57039|nr:carboxypeptidase regulatory-like domain-containing protein [Nocardioides sp. W7]